MPDLGRGSITGSIMEPRHGATAMQATPRPVPPDTVHIQIRSLPTLGIADTFNNIRTCSCLTVHVTVITLRAEGVPA